MMKFFGKNKPTFTNHIKISEPYIVPVFSDKPKYTLSDHDIKVIENFLEKDSPVMEFDEICAIVKMQLAIYSYIMVPRCVLNCNDLKGENKDAKNK